MSMRIALATYRDLPQLAPDDRLAARELQRRGALVEPVAWDAPDVHWTAYDAVVVRSCWDYHLRTAEFHDWLDGLEATGARVWNPVPLLRWNADKRYLRTLAEAGVPTVATRWVERGSDVTLAALLDQEGWSDAVVKPVISASAHSTWRTGAHAAADDEARFRELLCRADVMVQPFLPAVFDGEWSLCFIAHRFSHAVRKLPAAGDFRVQEEHAGRTVPAHPPAHLIERAAGILSRVDEAWLYARVDGCEVGGDFRLLELEMLEPSLFLHHDASAAGRFANAILAVCA